MENCSGAGRPGILRLLKHIGFSMGLRLSIHPNINRTTVRVPPTTAVKRRQALIDITVDEGLSVPFQGSRILSQAGVGNSNEHDFSKSGGAPFSLNRPLTQ
ncbi:hypothetical protein AB0O07_17245 [Streptomyces sp. NPDC093085]|uniref:hypothetical protein n=1 Tax=Streptomyces sp. NPDC093085 TaxID=3155068 RepID=UPI003427B125